ADRQAMHGALQGDLTAHGARADDGDVVNIVGVHACSPIPVVLGVNHRLPATPTGSQAVYRDRHERKRVYLSANGDGVRVVALYYAPHKRYDRQSSHYSLLWLRRPGAQ